MIFINELKRRNVIRVGIAYLAIAWLFIQVAEATFPAFGFSNNALRILIVVLAAGLVPALVFSWAFEFTPEGIRKEKDVDRNASVTPQTGKKLDRVIMVVLALAVGYFLIDRLVLSPEREAEIAAQAQKAGAEQALEEARLGLFMEKSIAVLPFVNRSSESGDEFFTDGMHDELLTRLAKIAALKVISRTSVLKYRNSNKTMAEIAEELSVATILEGAVQRAGNQVRINVQLIDARTDEHLWAELFDRELTTENLFAIQSEISTHIAEQLKAKLTPQEAGRVADLPTHSLEAYNLYLRGRQLLTKWRPQEASEALEAFQQAVEIDPDYAQAWVGIADALTVYRSYSVTAPGYATYQESLNQREMAVETALALDDQLGEAYTALGALLEETGEQEKAGAAYRKGIELSPGNAQALEWFGDWLWIGGNREEALATYYRAAELDPLSSVIQSSIGRALDFLGRDDEALAQFLRIIEFDPEFVLAYRMAGDLNIANGQLAGAARYYRDAILLDPNIGFNLRAYANVFLAIEDYEAVQSIQQTLLDRLGNEGAYYSAVLDWFVYAGQGEWQKIFDIAPNLPEGLLPPRVLHRGLANAYFYNRDFDRAKEHLLLWVPGWANPEQWPELLEQQGGCSWGLVFQQTGDEQLGDDLILASIDALKQSQTGSPEEAYQLGYCYLAAREFEAAFETMETAVEVVADWTWFLGKLDPAWDPVRNDPRYLDLAERMKELIDEQREQLQALGYLDNVIP